MEKVSEPEVDLMSQSIYGTLIDQTTKHGGPFSGKRVIHTSDTPHDNSCPQGKFYIYKCYYIPCVWKNLKNCVYNKDANRLNYA